MQNFPILDVRLVSENNYVCYWLWTGITFEMFGIRPITPSYVVLKQFVLFSFLFCFSLFFNELRRSFVCIFIPKTENAKCETFLFFRHLLLFVFSPGWNKYKNLETNAHIYVVTSGLLEFCNKNNENRENKKWGTVKRPDSYIFNKGIFCPCFIDFRMIFKHRKNSLLAV